MFHKILLFQMGTCRCKVYYIVSSTLLLLMEMLGHGAIFLCFRFAIIYHLCSTSLGDFQNCSTLGEEKAHFQPPGHWKCSGK